MTNCFPSAICLRSLQAVRTKHKYLDNTTEWVWFWRKALKVPKQVKLEAINKYRTLVRKWGYRCKHLEPMYLKQYICMPQTCNCLGSLLFKRWVCEVLSQISYLSPKPQGSVWHMDGNLIFLHLWLWIFFLKFYFLLGISLYLHFKC